MTSTTSKSTKSMPGDDRGKPDREQRRKGDEKTGSDDRVEGSRRHSSGQHREGLSDGRVRLPAGDMPVGPRVGPPDQCPTRLHRYHLSVTHDLLVGAESHDMVSTAPEFTND